MKKLILIAFMAVATECENWGDMYFATNGFNSEYKHPRCIEKNTIFQTKEELAIFLKQQDHRSYPHHRAYKIEPLEYDLDVETEQQKRTQEVIETVEIKREVKFK